jgi:hypothetical protein
VELLLSRGVGQIRCQALAQTITSGVVDVGKHLRPNLRGGEVVLFVEPMSLDGNYWRAVRLP